MDEDRIYRKILRKREEKMKSGERSHSKHLGIPNGHKSLVIMRRYYEGDKILRLISDPFDTVEEASHFAESFSDNFLYDTEIVVENGKYCVLTDWLEKQGFYSYNIYSKGQYWEFSNGS